MQSPVVALCVIAKATEKSRFMPEFDLEQEWKITESINMDVRRPFFFAFFAKIAKIQICECFNGQKNV